MSTWRADVRVWVMRLLLVVAGPLLVLGALEVALRVAGYGCPASFVLREGNFWTSNDRFGWRFFPRALATTPWPFRVATPKPAGTYRVVVLGESAAEGTPDPSFGFSRMLEAMLQVEHPQRRFEVVNAAMTAINSHVIRLIAEDCRALEPDLVVVYMGNNEVVGPFGPGSVFGGAPPNRALVRTYLWLGSTRVGQLMRPIVNWLTGAGEAPKAWQGMEMFMKHQMPADDPRLAGVYESFRANLRDIIATCRACGAQVIVATVASNLRDCPPFASLHRAGLSDADRKRWDSLYQAGMAHEAAGRHAEALRVFQEAARIDDRFAELVFRMAACRRQIGQFEEARVLYAKARDLDALRFRADSRLNEIIRETVADAREGVRLADVETAFARHEQSEDRVPGDALFYEHVHLTPRGNHLLASTIRMHMSYPPPPTEAPTFAACAAWLALTEVDEFRMAASIAEMTSRPPFSNQAGHAERQARRMQSLNRFRTQALAAALERVRTVYAEALQRSPADWQLRNNYGHLLMMAGDFTGAAAQWQAALTGVPSDSLMAAEFNLNIGEAVGRLGLFEEALPRFQAAARAWRDAPNPHRGLGEIYTARQQYTEAAAEFAKAIRLNPNHVPAINGLGMVKFHTNDFAGAAAEFARALAIEQSAPVHVNLGIALEKLGRTEEAISHYRQALQLDPNHTGAQNRLAAAAAAKAIR
ncbi:MAG: tetratricopeptide repeat protein [Verrucomicrobiae bacterium]|nr:tetratricopeptide repeat protein [Verrucomicrobiae bacterium]